MLYTQNVPTTVHFLSHKPRVSYSNPGVLFHKLEQKFFAALMLLLRSQEPSDTQASDQATKRFGLMHTLQQYFFLLCYPFYPFYVTVSI